MIWIAVKTQHPVLCCFYTRCSREHLISFYNFSKFSNTVWCSHDVHVNISCKNSTARVLFFYYSRGFLRCQNFMLFYVDKCHTHAGELLLLCIKYMNSRTSFSKRHQLLLPLSVSSIRKLVETCNVLHMLNFNIIF